MVFRNFSAAFAASSHGLLLNVLHPPFALTARWDRPSRESHGNV